MLADPLYDRHRVCVVGKDPGFDLGSNDAVEALARFGGEDGSVGFVRKEKMRLDKVCRFQPEDIVQAAIQFGQFVDQHDESRGLAR
ncbi:hypothetical protein LJR221_002036 [Agrobacterium tumefaciens]